MSIKRIPPWYREAIITIVGYVCIVVPLLIIILKPWNIQRDNFSVTGDGVLPPKPLREGKRAMPRDYIHSDTEDIIAIEVIELNERLTHLEHQLGRAPVTDELKSEPQKKKWLRFSSPNK